MKFIAVVAAMLSLGVPGVTWAEGEGGQCDCSHTHWYQDLKPTWYAGGSLNQSTFSDWSSLEAYSPSDPSFTSRTQDDSDTGFRIFGGMGFLNYFALEAGYAGFGDVSGVWQNDGSGPFFPSGPVTEDFSLDGYDLGFTAKLPLFNDAALVGKAAAFFWHSQTQLVDPDTLYFTQYNSGTSLQYGAGFEYDRFRPLRIVAAYNVATFDQEFIRERGKLESVGLSLVYLF